MISKRLPLIDSIPDLTQTSDFGKFTSLHYLKLMPHEGFLFKPNHMLGLRGGVGGGGGHIHVCDPFRGRLAEVKVRVRDCREDWPWLWCVCLCVVGERVGGLKEAERGS